MVMRLPRTVHARVVQMLVDDDKASASKTTTDGLTLHDGFNDR